MKVVYVAGPYRGKDAWEIAENIRAAERLALEVWRMGAACICPHANTANFQGAADDDLWLCGDLEIMARCDAVLMVPGWERSTGSCAEVEYAEQLGMPVFMSLHYLREYLNQP